MELQNKKCNYKVITLLKKGVYSLSGYIGKKMCNNNVITFGKCNHKVITLQESIYIVITFCLLGGRIGYAFELLTPVQEGQLIYGKLRSDEKLYIDYSLLNIDINLLNKDNRLHDYRNSIQKMQPDRIAGEKGGRLTDNKSDLTNIILKDDPISREKEWEKGIEIQEKPKEDLSDKYEIEADSFGNFVFGVPQNAPETLILYLKKNHGIEKKEIKINRVQWKEDIVNGLPPQKVVLAEGVQQRIINEALLLKKARASSETAFFPKKWILPLEKYSRISSPFGATRILNGIKKAGHSGTDFAAPTGTSVVAPADGRVKIVHSDMFYSGKTILIDHGYGVFSSYSHLNEIVVHENQVVKQGDKIGAVGTTGRSTGPHLHFTVTWFGVRVNPEFILSHELQK